VPCKKFHEEGVCHFGPRCQFLHKKDAKNEIAKISAEYKTLLDEVLKGFSCESLQEIRATKSVEDCSQQPKSLSSKMRKLRVFESVRE